MRFPGGWSETGVRFSSGRSEIGVIFPDGWRGSDLRFLGGWSETGVTLPGGGVG